MVYLDKPLNVYNRCFNNIKKKIFKAFSWGENLFSKYAYINVNATFWMGEQIMKDDEHPWIDWYKLFHTSLIQLNMKHPNILHWAVQWVQVYIVQFSLRFLKKKKWLIWKSTKTLLVTNIWKQDIDRSVCKHHTGTKRAQVS